jgi:hypothetical protein
MTATAAKLTKPALTPLRIFFLITVLLVMLVTAPFTVGVGVARVGDILTAFHHASCAWAEGSPLASWLVTAALGFSCVSYVVGLAMNEEPVFKTARRGSLAVVIGFALGIALEYLFICLPPMQALYDAFGAAGGTPAWLDGMSSFIVVVLANALHISFGFGVLAAFATADFS